MNTLQTVFLGIVQGLTEFLPISSSGHLVLFQNLLGFREPELLLDSALHLGTLVAVCIYFRTDLREMIKAVPHFDRHDPHGSLLLWVVVGSVPTGIIGLVFKNPLERLFGSVPVVGVMLVVTGMIVAGSRVIPEAWKRRTSVGLWAALAVGTAQGLAIIPGISRSGITIVCGLLCGLNRNLAGRFSFLVSIPAIIGALALQVNPEALQRVGFGPLFFGFAVSALVGLAALKILMDMVKKGHLFYFAPYCWVVGLIVILLSIT